MPRKNDPAYKTEGSIFAARLREIMKDRGENQTTLADKITAQYFTIQRQTISLYMSDQSRPDTERLTAIAKVLNVSADWLLGLTDVKSVDIDIQGFCQKTGLDECIAKYLIHLGAGGNTQMVLDNRMFYTLDNSILGIFNEIFQPENIRDLLCACSEYLKFVRTVKRDIETTEYYLENPEEIECPDFYYSFRSYYEDKLEYFKGNLEGEFVSALREDKFFRIEGMEKFSAVFDKFHKKYSEELELEIYKIRKLLAP